MSNYYLPVGKNSCLISQDYTEDVNKSIKLTYRIIITSVCLSEYALALGCNTGNIYLFHINDNHFKYWSSVFNSDSQISGIEFSPVKDFLAYYNKNSQIFIHKICFDNEMKSKLVRQVDTGTTECQIKQLLWSEDSTKLFYGCDDGRVDVIHVPQNTKDYLYIPTERLVKMPNQCIVQLDLCKDYLLISSNLKVVLYDLSMKTPINIGSRTRNGLYGACFWFDETGELKVVAARPNYRIWIASLKGDVEETQQYRNWDQSIVYNINKSESLMNGNGQFYFLMQLKSRLILAIDNSHLVLLLDLQKRCCLATLDCGVSYLSFIRNTGFINVNKNKDIIFISHNSIIDGITLLFYETNYRKAIDLFLEFKTDSSDVIEQSDNAEDSESNQNQDDENKNFLAHQVLSNIDPQFLTQLVQMSAELEYRFAETNQLQVELRQTPNYNRSGNELSSSLSTRQDSRDGQEESIHAIQLDRHLDTSGIASSSRSSMTNSSSNTKHSLTSTINTTATNLSTHFFKSMYEKTSALLTHNYLINPSAGSSDYTEGFLESSTRLIEPYNPSTDYFDDKNFVEEKVDLNPPEIRSMELESEIYIAWENLKKLDLFRKSSVVISSVEYKELEDTFLSSLSTMCKTWLNLIIQYWMDLFQYELNILNLSGTFIRNIPLSWSNTSNLELDNDESRLVACQIQNCPSNSWSNTIQESNWLKCLPISDKLQKLLSDLLSYCAHYSIFDKHPTEIDTIRQLLTNKITGKSLFSEIDNDWIDLQNNNNDKNFELNLIPTNQNEPIQYIIEYFNENLKTYIDYIDEKKIQEVIDLVENINDSSSNDDNDTSNCETEKHEHLCSKLVRLYKDMRNRIKIIQEKQANKQNKLIQTSCRLVEYQDPVSDRSSVDEMKTTSKLLDLLYSKIWNNCEKSKSEWIKVLLINFDSSFNQIIIRKWLESGITHEIWKMVVGSYNEVYSSTLKSKLYRSLDQRTAAQLQKLLYESVYFEDMKDFVIGNRIIEVLNSKDELFPWKSIVKAGNLSARSAMHFCLLYHLDFADYLLNLFQFERPLVYSTRNQLLAHIYEMEDVLVAFIFSMLYKYRSDTQINLNQCNCGAVLSLDSISLPENYQALTTELIQYGVKQGIFRTNERLKGIIMDICLQNGYSEGYIELVLCDSDWKKLVMVGFQLRNYEILTRLKDLNLSSPELWTPIIYNLVETKRNFKPELCLQCAAPVSDNYTHNSNVISWDQLGQLLFTDLRTVQNTVGLIHCALGLLTVDEINSGIWRANTTELINEMVKPSCTEPEESTGLLAQFIELEMNECDGGMRKRRSSVNQTSLTSMSSSLYNLTEKYLDLYGCDKSELCGVNWGRVFNPDSSLCDLCSRRLFLYTNSDSGKPRSRSFTYHKQSSANLEILAFPCGHAFHEICLSAFHYLDHCIFC